jgi:hypothetical protein
MTAVGVRDRGPSLLLEVAGAGSESKLILGSISISTSPSGDVLIPLLLDIVEVGWGVKVRKLGRALGWIPGDVKVGRDLAGG